MSFRRWTRGPNRTIFSTARVNDAIQPRVPWQRARHLPLGHIFRRGVTPCLITQPGWLSPVASTIEPRLQHVVISGVCERVCTWLSNRALLETPPPGPYCITIAKKPWLSILAWRNDSHELPNKGKALVFPKHSCFNCCEKLILREKECKCAWISY